MYMEIAQLSIDRYIIINSLNYRGYFQKTQKLNVCSLHKRLANYVFCSVTKSLESMQVTYQLRCYIS